LVPWYEVAVDLIGPWTLQVHGQEIEFWALTCIDTVSNLVEVVRIENKSAAATCRHDVREPLAIQISKARTMRP
jgi:hypothetical protein